MISTIFQLKNHARTARNIRIARKPLNWIKIGPNISKDLKNKPSPQKFDPHRSTFLRHMRTQNHIAKSIFIPTRRECRWIIKDWVWNASGLKAGYGSGGLRVPGELQPVTKLTWFWFLFCSCKVHLRGFRQFWGWRWIGHVFLCRLV